ncbi:TRAP transporter large permease subunit [Desulfovibrio sp. OttesenSCG-928-C06]|nr:TRAP transporter large permease subunit [Desulfovibrio sp. OttesenSCG-928-C06]
MSEIPCSSKEYFECNIPVLPKYLTIYDKLISPLYKLLFFIAKACICILAVLATVDVILRFTFKLSVPGAPELIEMLMAVLVFTSLAYIQRVKGNIRIDFVLKLLPERTHPVFALFTFLLSTVLFILMAWRLGVLTMHKYASGEHTLELMIPLFLFQAICALGLVALILSVFYEVLCSLDKLLRTKSYFGILIALLVTVAVITLPWWFTGMEMDISRSALGGLGMVLMFGLMLCGMPIGFAMAGAGLLGLLILNMNFTAAFTTLGLGPFSYAASSVLTVIPMFCLMGEVAFYSSISRDMFNTASTWLGRLPAGLAVASVTGCAGFAAVCGESLATAVTMASVALPEMRAKKYDTALACATLAAGGTLGILIPPSIGFIFYSIITEESVGRLFLAGFVPGLMLAGFFIAVLMYIAIRHPERLPRGDATSMGEKLKSLKGIIAIVIIMIIILGGILAGICTPTEGGAVGAVATIILAICKRSLTFKTFNLSMEAALDVTAKLMIILIGVNLLSFFFAATRLPNALADFFVDADMNRFVILAFIVVFYVIGGCLMNALPLMLLTLPTIYPTILGLGFDPIWFGVVMVILIETGQITPPVGVNIYALSTVAKDVPMEKMFKNVLPFFLCMIFAIVVLTMFPVIATFLPDLAFGPRMNF